MIPFPDKKYNIIYADPAWTFKTWSNKGEEKSPKYDVMTINDIKNLPLNEIIENDCVLFIWVTYPLLIIVCPMLLASRPTSVKSSTLPPLT